MARKIARRKQAVIRGDAEIINIEKFAHERVCEPIQPKTENQKLYLRALKSSPMILATGPAGVGKTWIAATFAADLLRQRRIDHVVLTRPNVSISRSLGFMPGDMIEKFGHWCRPFLDAMQDRIGKGAFEIALKNEDIQMVPLEVVRGRSFKNSLIFVDESQSLTVAEAKALATRVGEGSTIIFAGDLNQSDIRGENGLEMLLRILDRHPDLPITHVAFGLDDIVRSDLCAQMVRAFLIEKI